MPGDRPILTLADLEAFDPQAPDRRPERRFCCPLCGTAKPIDARHRCLSLRVETGAWHCHRCDASGVLREKWAPLPPRERQRATVRRAFALPSREAPDPDKATSLRARLKEARLQSLEGTSGAAYLEGRGLDTHQAHQAGVRYSPSWHGRPAVVFPLRDRNGVLVAAHGRHTDGRDDPKAHTDGPKSAGAFATPGALDSVPLVIVEGPMCALTLAQAGIPALALCGTDGPEWLPRHTAFRHVFLALDADAAGDKGAEKLADALRSLGALCERLRPEGVKDWNDLLTSAGPDALRAALAPVLAAREAALTEQPTAAPAPDRCPCGAEAFGYSPDGRPYCQAHRAAVLAHRCPRCLSLGHTIPGPECNLPAVVCGRDFVPGPVAPLGTPAGVEYEPGQDWQPEELAHAWCPGCGGGSSIKDPIPPAVLAPENPARFCGACRARQAGSPDPCLTVTLPLW